MYFVSTPDSPGTAHWSCQGDRSHIENEIFHFCWNVEVVNVMLTHSILVHLEHSWRDKKLNSWTRYQSFIIVCVECDECRSVQILMVIYCRWCSKYLSCGGRAPDLSSPLRWALILISDSYHIALNVHLYLLVLDLFASGCLEPINEFSRCDQPIRHHG